MNLFFTISCSDHNLVLEYSSPIPNRQQPASFYCSKLFPGSYLWLITIIHDSIMTHLISTVLNNSWVIMNLVTSLFFNVKSWEVNFIFSKKIFTKRKANIKRQILSILSKDLDLTFFLRSIQTSRSPGRWISKKLYHGQFDQNWQNIKNLFPNMTIFEVFWNRKDFVLNLLKLIVLLPFMDKF